MIETRLIHEGDSPEFLDVPAFFGTKQGWYVNTPTLFGIAHVPAKTGPSTLGDIKTAFHMNDTKLPQWLIMKAHDFFKKIWEKQHTEAMVYIVHHPEKDTFGLWVPEQYVNGAAVNYRLQPGQIKGGWLAVGTIHSHCNFAAFHSGTDQHDMGGMPGIHITIGHVDRDWPDFAVALSANGKQFDVDDIESVIDRDEPKDHKGYDFAPEWWMELAKTGSAPWKGEAVKYSKGSTQKSTWTPKSGYQFDKERFKNTLPNDWTQAAWGDDEWTHFGTLPDEDKDLDTLPTGFTQIGLDALIEDNITDPFNLFNEEVALSQKLMDEEVEQMAYLGFTIAYTINWNPTVAAQWLKDTGKDTDFIDLEEWSTD